MKWFSVQQLFFIGSGGHKGHINLGEEGRGLRGECTSVAEAEVLGMLHFHGKELQVVAGHVP